MRSTSASTCILCGSTGTILHRDLPDRLFGVAGQWDIRQCDNTACHLAWLDPKPVEADLGMAYASYYTHGDTVEASPVKARAGLSRRVIRFFEAAWLEVLLLGPARRGIETAFLNQASPGRVLEVGCGDGALLQRLQARGWTVEGQDLDEKAVQRARGIGLTVHHGPLADLALPAETYDAVIMNHVIEHAYDPVALARDCRRLLRPGGQFVAITPNIESYGHAKFGHYWLGLDPPRHLHLFSQASFHALASSAGFETVAVWTSCARTGGFLAASQELRRYGQHQMRGRLSVLQVVAATAYQLLSRVAYLRRPDTGDELILRGRK